MFHTVEYFRNTLINVLRSLRYFHTVDRYEDNINRHSNKQLTVRVPSKKKVK